MSNCTANIPFSANRHKVISKGRAIPRYVSQILIPLIRFGHWGIISPWTRSFQEYLRPIKGVVWIVTIPLYNLHIPCKESCGNPCGKNKAHHHPCLSLPFYPSTLSIFLFPTLYQRGIHPCKWPNSSVKRVVDKHLPCINATKPRDMSNKILDVVGIYNPIL